MKDNKENNSKKYAIYALFLIIGIIVGSGLMLVVNPSKTIIKNIAKGKDNKFNALYETYNTIKDEYYNDISDEKLVNGAINGMMGALEDEHSVFLDKQSKENFETELSGKYYGIGAEITQINENDVMINKVFDASPAEKAGLKQGDIFVSIDGKSVKGQTVNDIASNLRSDKKDTATIVVLRDEKEETIKVTKDNVTLLSVSSEMLEDNVGYISVNIFGQMTSSQFKTALEDLEKQGMKSLIIDLRGNSGGYLRTVTEMISMFVDNKTVIYQMKTKDGIKKYTSLNNDTKNYKVIILVDESSASASEIMASAMQEQYGATLVGKTTYGKGTVQETKELSNGTLIKYTVQEWLTSKGESINKKGVTPDVEVDLSEEYNNNPLRENDNQFNKALELAK